ncbi:hypothetical protein AU509_07005 [Lonsdalea britannica]|uniref:LuxR family transcriptional regulator n=1 Tax=Lonsdalea britannica TaxID=1082704 RepID=A0AAD0WLF4_9GAMM|nr:LuxR C-terminal-related transcriptional regulator [Lonsdalea britannica]AXW87725.1 LuxR family transcriptional regulator [Lonsdalea britannica]OSM98274.1 hypothetical protein AU509_07005 [Lonsdalea britannica]OSN09431.1 hypothetical protein AU510_01210 [Lonsdalea britannica]
MDYVFLVENEIISYSLQNIIISKIMTDSDKCYVAADICDLVNNLQQEKEQVFLIEVLHDCSIISSLVDVIKYVNSGNKIVLFKDSQPDRMFRYINYDAIIDLKSPIVEIISKIQDVTHHASGPSWDVQLQKLSPREQLVLQYLLKGKSNKEVSGLLCLSEKTISCHKQSMLRKLNIKSIMEASQRR